MKRKTNKNMKKHQKYHKSNKSKSNNTKKIILSKISKISNKNGLNLERVICDYELRTNFDNKTILEAENKQINQNDYENREDFRLKTIFTIDGIDAKDFDDAVSIEKNQNGYLLGVHIADVTHFVKANSRLDKEAMLRGTSVYFPFGSIPMLPSKLSDDLCSLKPNEDRLTLSILMQINHKGIVEYDNIYLSVINSCARLTYNLAQNILDGEETKIDSKVINDLKIMEQLANILIKKRSDCIDIDSNECEFEFKNDLVVDVKKRERLFSHRIIEEFMILANETIAKRFNKKLPFLYRTHDKVSPLKAQRLADFLYFRGIDLVYKDSPSVKQLKEISNNASKEFKPVLDMMILRSMQKAIYSPQNKGHFGLNISNYCHFTSPIRRYPDLFIHRVIKAVILNQNVKQFSKGLEDLAFHCSYKEKLADEAERFCDDFLKAQVLKQYVGKVFSGIISSVTEFGLFVKLNNTAEGLIRIESLDGFYNFCKESLSLIGKKNYSLGDRIDIKILSVKGGKAEFILNDDKKLEKLCK